MAAGTLLVGCDGCGASTAQPVPAASHSGGAVQLSPELANRVLATVGEKKITLGDYATALDRMDQFERLRYQTAERRRSLLEEMINVELLAREAERRGLDQRPEAKAHVQQILREELIRDLRAQQPRLDELPVAEVRKYYDDHRPEFFDPARRRVAAFSVSTRARAEQALKALGVAGAADFGRVARKFGGRSSASPRPLEFEGDLGLVSAPGEIRGVNDQVPEPVRAAVFSLSGQGDIYPSPVEHKGRFFVVRLMGLNPARARTFEEVESVIRARLLQTKLRQAEAQLDAELRKTLPIRINQEALRQLKLPKSVKPEVDP